VTEAQKVPRRDEIPPEYTWDLTTVYADDAAWEQDIAALEAQLPEIAALQGRVAESAAALLGALRLRDEVYKRLERIYYYASHRHDSDSGDAAGQELSDRAGSLLARISAALAFVDPEILAVREETVRVGWRASPNCGCTTTPWTNCCASAPTFAQPRSRASWPSSAT
jgi:oligoendopeptidase F